MKKINFYLLKLKFFQGVKVEKNKIDKKNLPDNIYLSKITGEYTKIDCKDINVDELDTFIKVKNAYNFNIIRICLVVCTFFFALAIIDYL